MAEGGNARRPEDARKNPPEPAASAFHNSNTRLRDLIIAGPAPAPLLRAETFYRYQIMLRVQRMSALSAGLAKLTQSLALPEHLTLTVDIDPVGLG